MLNDRVMTFRWRCCGKGLEYRKYLRMTECWICQTVPASTRTPMSHFHSMPCKRQTNSTGTMATRRIKPASAMINPSPPQHQASHYRMIALRRPQPQERSPHLPLIILLPDKLGPSRGRNFGRKSPDILVVNAPRHSRPLAIGTSMRRRIVRSWARSATLRDAVPVARSSRGSITCSMSILRVVKVGGADTTPLTPKD